MALLEEATMAEMVDFIGQSIKEVEASNSAEAIDEQPEAEPEETMEASEASEDVNEEEASPSDTEEDVKEEPGEEEVVVEVQAEGSEPEEPSQQRDSKWVPRGRLNAVTDKWKRREQELMMQVGALNERVSHLSTQKPAPQAPSESGDWLDALIDDEPSGPSPMERQMAEVRKNQAEMLNWREQQVKQQVFTEFNQELQSAMEQYPSISEQVFRDAVARDGSVNMVELGETLSLEREQMVNQWKSDWDKSQPKVETQEPEAVRRPSRRSTVTSAPPKSKEKSYSTVREAGDAMANELADFFESLNQ